MTPPTSRSEIDDDGDDDGDGDAAVAVVVAVTETAGTVETPTPAPAPAPAVGVAVAVVVADADALRVVETTLRCPFTTDTVSMVPVPFGPSTVSVLSGLNSLRDWWSRSDRSQGMGVSSAPPSDSSLPRFEAAE